MSHSEQSKPRWVFPAAVYTLSIHARNAPLFQMCGFFFSIMAETDRGMDGHTTVYVFRYKNSKVIRLSVLLVLKIHLHLSTFTFTRKSCDKLRNRDSEPSLSYIIQVAHRHLANTNKRLARGSKIIGGRASFSAFLARTICEITSTTRLTRKALPVQTDGATRSQSKSCQLRCTTVR